MLGAAWTASAAAAVGLGFLAVSLVGASAAPRPAAGSAATSPSWTPGPAAPSDRTTTIGGTVYASCAGGTADVAGAPAPGWWVDDSGEPGQVEFSDGARKVEVRATCVDGGPRFSVEEKGAGPASPSSPAAPSATEDSGGGHGSDAPAGDDSSGRGGGGHGSDG